MVEWYRCDFRKVAAVYPLEFSFWFMLIFMLGLLLATAILALKTVSNVQEMLVPEPIRVK